MRAAFLVGAGGFIGAVARHLVTGLCRQFPPGTGFPWGTLVVNCSGCLVIGMLAAWADVQQPLTAGTRLFLLTGLLGGYTTFSAFGLETFLLGRAQLVPLVVANVAAQVTLGVVAVAVGYRAVSLLAS